MGRFITFEGGEGSGKTTQARLLADRMREKGIEPVLTREPGGTLAAEDVRNLLLDPAAAPRSVLSEALLFYAARADHIEKLVQPMLADGHWVICDRFSDSTRVYQVEAGQLPLESFRALARLVVDRTRPDLTFILDLPVNVGLAHASARRSVRGDAADAYEKRDVEFHELRGDNQGEKRATIRMRMRRWGRIEGRA